ncbi:MAG: GNAT family N-acetyltransferase [Anaerolineales bacterium]
MIVYIEKAQAEQASTLTKIAISAKRHWNYPERWIELWTPALTISPDYISKHETWLAIINEKPVGFYSLVQDDEAFWLDNLWILPDFMGKGIGKKLFQHVLERCRALNVSALKIEADPNAQSFYEKMGAHKVGERHSQVDGQPRILPIMEINL